MSNFVDVAVKIMAEENTESYFEYSNTVEVTEHSEEDAEDEVIFEDTTTAELPSEEVEILEEEIPPVETKSLTDRIQELYLSLESGICEYSFEEPQNLTTSALYTRDYQGTKYLGTLYTNADTGKDYKFVDTNNKTVYF